MRHILKYWFIILSLMLAPFFIASAETLPPLPDGRQIIIHSADYIKHLEEAQLLEAIGNVAFEYGAMRLKADYVKVDFAERMVSAEGNIILYYGQEKFYGTSLLYNLDTELWALTQPETLFRHWFIEGEELRKIDDRIYIVERASIICPCPQPCYLITAREVEVHQEEKLRAYHSFFWVGGIPVAYLPVYEMSLREVVRYPGYGEPHRLVMRPGYDAHKGWFLWAYYNWYVSPELRGRFYLDHFEYLDAGIGFDVEYQTKDGEGFFYAYSTREEIFLPGKERARWKLHLRHRHQVTENTVGLLGIDSFSDGNFNIDFEREERWKRFTKGELDAQRENPGGFFSLLQIKPDYALELYTRMRLDDWASPFTERIPELSFDLFRRRVGGTPFFWDGDGSIARLRHFPTDVNVTQVNINSEISRPGSIRWLRLEPALRAEGFAYSRDRLGKESYMGNYEVSLAAHTRLYSPIFRFGGMDMYHLFKPRITYYYSPPPPARRGDLFEFVDKLDDEKDFFDLEAGNRFIRLFGDRREKGFADLTMRTRFYRDGRKNPWGPLTTKLSLWPAAGISFWGWTSYNLNVGRLENIKASLSYQMTPDLKVSLSGHYNWRDARYEEWEVGLTRRIGCWKVHFSLQERLDERRAFIGFQLKHIIDDITGIEAGNW
jgi:lipopolysaccharide assembly outer membrane protein LptD (OstA)